MQYAIEKQIGIIGVGMVGSTILNYYNRRPGLHIRTYDKFKKLGSIEEVNMASVVFICVPTPYTEKGADLSAVEEAIDVLKENKIIIIKSTVLPGTTDKFQNEYPQHKILHIPEFLTEKNAASDFAYPERIIVGFTEQSKDVTEEIRDFLPNSHSTFIVPAAVAEMAKFFGNVFLASKVIFGNQIYDLCKKLNIDYKQVAELGGKDSRIGVTHLDVFADGYRGYEGACFKKDMKALIKFARDNEVPMHQLEITDKINDKLFEDAKKESESGDSKIEKDKK